MDIFVEQILKIKTPKKAGVIKVALVVAAIIAATTIPSMRYVGLGLMVLMIASLVIVSKYFDAEYEYALCDGELTIERIMARSYRRRCASFNIAKATLVAAVDSQAALRLAHSNYRTSDYTSGNGKDGVIVVYTYNQNNEMERLYIEPDEKLLEGIKKVVGRDVYAV